MIYLGSTKIYHGFTKIHLGFLYIKISLGSSKISLGSIKIYLGTTKIYLGFLSMPMTVSTSSYSFSAIFGRDSTQNRAHLSEVTVVSRPTINMSLKIHFSCVSERKNEVECHQNFHSTIHLKYFSF